ncbi:ATP-binding protein [Chloroflexota bacterium]
MMSNKVCIDCGGEYEPNYLEVLGTKRLNGRGRCPSCHIKALGEYEAIEATRQAREVISRRRDARSKVGIPPRYMKKDFSSFEKGRGKEIDRAFRECCKYAEDYPIGRRPEGYRSLLIYSEHSWGVGKTHLSCSIAHRIFDRWEEPEHSTPKILWISEPELYARIQASYNYTYEERQIMPNEDSIIKDLIYRDLLILDDVGKEKRTDPKFRQRTLFKIINGRYNLDIPVVITANLSPVALKDYFGTLGSDEASWDRLYEMIDGEAIKIDGESYRRKERKDD